MRELIATLHDNKNRNHALTSTEIVRCKDCVKRSDPMQCPMQHSTHIPGSLGDIIEDMTREDGFCDRGERNG